MYDLVVIGGGPAGSAAAITACRLGADVLLLERGRFPRHKVCGEFVSAESLDLLGSLLGDSCRELLDEAPRISQGRLFADDKVISAPVDPPAASIARYDLDEALWESARRCGVQVRSQTIVQSILGPGPFKVITSEREFEAKAVINASGRWSNLTAAPGNRRPQEKWLGVKAHFIEANPSRSVDLYFFEGGYCGVQPVDVRLGSINACAMVRAEVASTLEEVFAQHPALQERSRRWQVLSDPVTTSPLIFCRPDPMQYGIFMAGDAAAFVDPFVGDGISLALRSGTLAAECLEEFLSGREILLYAQQRYHKAYEKRFARVFRTSSKIRTLLRLPRPVRQPFLFALENVPGIARYLVSRTR
jgi:menaquinone-9 beta-reductase